MDTYFSADNYVEQKSQVPRKRFLASQHFEIKLIDSGIWSESSREKSASNLIHAVDWIKFFVVFGLKSLFPGCQLVDHSELLNAVRIS